MNLPKILLAAAGFLFSTWVWAQMGDPTRPAIEPSVASAEESAPPVKTGLQSILRRKGARPAAIINGQVVELGAKVGDARLLQINESEVVLQGPAGREELRLTPAVEKSSPILPPSADRPGGGLGKAKK